MVSSCSLVCLEEEEEVGMEGGRAEASLVPRITFPSWQANVGLRAKG